MAPTRTRKRKSDMSSSATSSPIKKQRKMGLSILQKQALIDNLQLELTERARRLRAQYNVQAQHLRSRVEMRINRIPTALRKATMGDLLSKSLEPPKPRPTRPAFTARPPPVPAKDGASPKPIVRKTVTKSAVAPIPASRGMKRLTNDLDGNKENQNDAVDNPKKRVRAHTTTATGKPIQSNQILSPTSSNGRILPRDRPMSPTKSMLGRPVSPVKPFATKSSANLLSNMVEKAKGIRSAAGRKGTMSSTSSSNQSATTAASAPARGRKTPVPGSTAGPPSTTRGRRKISAGSESSEGSTATVVKKSATARAAGTKSAASIKRPGTAMSTTKSAAAKKAAPVKTATTPAATGRTLRKRAAV